MSMQVTFTLGLFEKDAAPHYGQGDDFFGPHTYQPVSMN